MCGALAILSKLSEWLHTKDVSQLVLTSWEIFVESPDVKYSRIVAVPDIFYRLGLETRGHVQQEARRHM